MFKSIAIVSLSILLVCGCVGDNTSREDGDLDLISVFEARDTVSFNSLVVNRPKTVRDALDETMRQWMRDRAFGFVGEADSLARTLDWLTGQYARVSGNYDKRRKFTQYGRWSVQDTREKLVCDSSLALADSQFRAGTENSKEQALHQYLASLHTLLARYGVLQDSFALATVNFELATRFEALNLPDSARLYLNHSLDISRALDFLEIAGNGEHRLGRYWRVNDANYGQAKRAFGRAHTYYDRAGMTTMYVLAEQAHLLTQIYRSEEAIELYRKLFAMSDSAGNDPLAAFSLSALSELFVDVGQFDSASSYTAKAMQFLEQSHLSDDEKTDQRAWYLSSAGLIAHVLGDTATAVDNYNHVQGLLVGGKVNDNSLFCTNSIRFANCLIGQGQYHKARGLAASTLREAIRFEDRLFALYALAVSDYYLGDIESAKHVLHLCIQRFEQSRASLPQPEAKVGILTDRIGFYNLLAVIFANEYRHDNTRESLDSAYHYLERSKAQSLLEMLSKGSDDRNGEFNSLQRRFFDLQDDLLLGAVDSASSMDLLIAMEDSLQDLSQGQGGKRSGPSDFAWAKPISLRDIQRRLLHKDEVVLEYLLSDFGSFVLAISNTNVSLLPIASSYTAITDSISSYQNELTHYPTPAKRDDPWRMTASALYHMLIPDSCTSLTAGEQLVIVPSGPLHNIPLEALIDDNGKFLIESKMVRYCPSMTVLNGLMIRRGSAVVPARLVAFGNPEFGDSAFEPLPFTAMEIDSLVGLFGNRTSKAFTGSDANASTLRAITFDGNEILHIATHGIVDKRFPDRSALVLAGAGPISDPSLLYARDIGEMTIPVEMVFLSVCQSGAGRSFPGEGIISLEQPFLVAGTQSVVATQWEVFDRFATEFSPKFYRGYLAGMSATESLAKVKREFIHSNNPLYRHPFFWAPYTLVGLN